MTRLTVKYILKKAIDKEIESQQLYIDLTQRVSDEAAKDAFRMLTQQEKEHQKLLEEYLCGKLTSGALAGRHTVDYRIAEHFDQPQLSPDMKLPEVFLLAANREKASSEFYSSFAAVHPAGKVKRLLEKLAAEELGHKRKVETLYTQVAFPQTAGG